MAVITTVQIFSVLLLVHVSFLNLFSSFLPLFSHDRLSGEKSRGSNTTRLQDSSVSQTGMTAEMHACSFGSTSRFICCGCTTDGGGPEKVAKRVPVFFFFCVVSLVLGVKSCICRVRVNARRIIVPRCCGMEGEKATSFKELFFFFVSGQFFFFSLLREFKRAAAESLRRRLFVFSSYLPCYSERCHFALRVAWWR